MKYLIIGTGGVGGSIASFLHMAGNDVTCIARGEALEAMRQRGLVLHSDLKGEHTLHIPAYSSEEYAGKADVIFVTVKGYSIDSVASVISRASHPGTIVIPVLNVYGTGARISALTPGVNVLDGCIYIVGFKSGIGEISQMGTVFHLVFGVPKGREVPAELLDTVCTDLSESCIKVTLSDDIDRDTFIKWSFISAMAVTGAYYDIPMGPIQHPGRERDTFIGLSQESAALGRHLGIDLGPDPVAHHLAVIDALDPASTASMQKDLRAGHESEIQGMLFDIIDRARAANIPTPTYDKVAQKFTRPNKNNQE
ncbi:MAG: ketopantoate reductase family protein [Candidatus Amulumruptor caecigallinarius]|nr:ketopantoate reductase family protein [Candidatus Amulumruptor caecigallinarius]MCM1395969.1 ketopantoate reductase family protein [Candidatus Amulumruptor caecigallinarius]